MLVAKQMKMDSKVQSHFMPPLKSFLHSNNVVSTRHFTLCMCVCLLLSDKMFPAFGFGAQVPPEWQVSTCVTLGLLTVHFSLY